MDSRPFAGTGSIEPADEYRVLMIRLRPGENGAQQAVHAAGLPWPDGSQPRAVSQGWFGRLSPTHGVLVSSDRVFCAAVADHLAAGTHDTVMAIDITEGTSIFEIEGCAADGLVRICDQDLTPQRQPWIGTRRMGDVPVVALQKAASAWLLLVERSYADHLHAHLTAAPS